MRLAPASLLLLLPLGMAPAEAQHIHLVDFKCEGEKDGVRGWQNGVYFACRNGKVVCSQDGVIPQSWIAEYDRKIADHKKGISEMRARVDRLERDRGRSSSSREMSDAMAEHRRRVAEMRRRRSGSGSGNVASNSGAVRVVGVNAPPQPSKIIPVEEVAVRDLALGLSTGEVLAQLGEPKMKLSGDGERWTYKLTTGQSATLVFAGGRLTQVNLP